MIRNKIKLNKFYQRLIEKENISYKKALLIYEALHKEAVSLGIIDSKNILEGLYVDLRIAKTINPVRKKIPKISVAPKAKISNGVNGAR